MAKIERNPRVIQYSTIPSIDIAADYTVIDQYDAVQFSNNTVDAVEWYWDFGDGFTSTEQNPTHVYGGGAGSFYTVTLIVKDSLNRVGIAVKKFFIKVVNDSYLGDKITNPEFIISLYKLTAQTTKAIRIRENNNNNEIDIGYESNQPHAKIDINAVNTFLSNNNASKAYITRFYNQLDNSIILEESNASYQASLKLDKDGDGPFVRTQDANNRNPHYDFQKSITIPQNTRIRFFINGYMRGFNDSYTVRFFFNQFRLDFYSAVVLGYDEAGNPGGSIGLNTLNRPAFEYSNHQNDITKCYVKINDVQKTPCTKHRANGLTLDFLYNDYVNTSIQFNSIIYCQDNNSDFDSQRWSQFTNLLYNTKHL